MRTCLLIFISMAFNNLHWKTTLPVVSEFVFTAFFFIAIAQDIKELMSDH
jgi:hypothetical protein